MAEFPSTLASLILRVTRLLESEPGIDALGAAISSTSATSITVTTGANFAKSARIEIDNELMNVTADPSGTTVTVSRGISGTTAATHTNGSEIRINPRYPRVNIIDAINTILGNWIPAYMPRMIWDTTTAGTFLPNVFIYPAPSDAFRLDRVTYLSPGVTDYVDVEHGPLMPYPTSVCSTGYGFKLHELGLTGRTVNLYLAKPWPFLSGDSDTVPSDFPVMADDLIVTGAALYLLGWRMTPKFRLDESVFSREQGRSLPSTFSLQSMQLMARNWVDMMKRVQTRRPSGTDPKKVFIGRT